MTLGARLSAVYGLLEPCGVFADIGTDHAMLAVQVLKSGLARRAVLSDIAKGPLERARENVIRSGLSEFCDFRLGDGLSVLGEGEADIVCVCGMGGETILSVIEAGVRKTSSLIRLVVQAQSRSHIMRAGLCALPLKETRIVYAREGRMFYQAVALEPGIPEILTPEECMFPSRNVDLRPDGVYAGYLAFQERLLCDLTRRAAGTARGEQLSQTLGVVRERLALCAGY